jgi:hypothetical protein
MGSDTIMHSTRAIRREKNARVVSAGDISARRWRAINPTVCGLGNKHNVCDYTANQSHQTLECAPTVPTSKEVRMSMKGWKKCSESWSIL